MVSKFILRIYKADALETSRVLNIKGFKINSKMGFRLLLLMAMGLGAMYMMHLLAQDYNKIRQPVAAAARVLTSASANLIRGKREAKTIYDQRPHQRNLKRQQQHQQHQESNQQPQFKEKLATVATIQRNATFGIDWKRILSRDPFECLQSLICQIMSGAEGNTQEAILLMDFLEATLSMAPAKIGHAFSRGLALRGRTERCYDEYPFCLYSAKTMLRVLRWFTNGYVEDG